MKYKTLIIWFVSVTVFSSCENDPFSDELISIAPSASMASLIDTSFQGFVNSIPILDSNFSLSNKKDFEHINLHSKFIPDGAGLIGRLNSIDNYAFIIYSYPADVRLPILEVYNSDGAKVNQKLLFKYGYCKLEAGPDNHDTKLSADGTKFYLTTSCIFAFSAFDYDSIVIRDLIFH